jgi:hypothetical protein
VNIIKLARGEDQPLPTYPGGYGAHTSIVKVAESRNGTAKLLLYEGRNCQGHCFGIAAATWQDAVAHSRSVSGHDPQFVLRRIDLPEAIARGLNLVPMVEIMIGYTSVGNHVRAHTFSLRPSPSGP